MRKEVSYDEEEISTDAHTICTAPGITGALVGRTAGQNVVTAAFFALE